MRSCLLPALILAGLMTLAPNAAAQMPRTMSFQGVLANASGTLVPDGNYEITLRLYATPLASSPLFTETHSNVPVVRGVMNVIIGSVTPIPQSLPFDRAYFLGVAINGGTELSPRTALTAAPYAMHAAVADQARTLAPGAGGVVTSLNGGDGALQLRGEGSTTINRTGGTITISSSGGGTGIQGVQSPSGALEISNGSGPVANLDIADGAVTTDKLADRSVTLDKLGDDVSLGLGGPAGGDLTGTYPNPEIDENSVTSRKIADGTITGQDVNTSADIDIANLNASGRIGVGTGRPLASIEVRGSNPIGLMVTRGGAVLSYREIRTAATVTVPQDVTVVRLTDDGEFLGASITMPAGLPGQFVIITNDDAQAASVFPGYLINSGQTRMFLYTGDSWRVVE